MFPDPSMENFTDPNPEMPEKARNNCGENRE